MATLNPFDLLGDNDTDDPSLLIAAQPQKIEPKKTLGASAKSTAAAKGPSSQNKAVAQPRLPSKPIPPTEAESQKMILHEVAAVAVAMDVLVVVVDRLGTPTMRIHMETGKYLLVKVHLMSLILENLLKGAVVVMVHLVVLSVVVAEVLSAMENLEENVTTPVGHMSGIVELDAEMRSNVKELAEGTGERRLMTYLCEESDEVVNEGEKTLDVEKPSGEEVAAADGDKETAANEVEEKPEDKEMTLEEYEKLLEEKRKALLALKTEERKVDAKEFETMQPLSNKKANDEIFIKLSSEKDKKKELAEKEERAKKSVSINEFLKPAEGEKYYSPGGRGRGRGRGGPRGGYSGGSETSNVKAAPSIEDPGQFPTLGGGK
ncbi:hypothetical protein PHJA_001195700 [Phtheirospermum japonicum]|uniref:Hyaluronan/mRNA-binding protein domain-containing protein n=1 Tax=Phtheirospermum japonicum TaxID=374723 RepID=A0A830BZW5_9LAMI|nr:hypothetical protein PHJA_001195700 [Phtheirospermum japonicum]